MNKGYTSRQNHESMSVENPDLYHEFVKRGYILEPCKQIELSRMNAEQFLDFLVERRSSEHIEIYPEYASNVIKSFSDEIYSGLNKLKPIDKKDLHDLRKCIGEHARMIELENLGNLFTQVPRKGNAAMQTGELEYKVKEAKPVEGPHFFMTTTGGYEGFLKFYTEEVGLIAPKEANAYLLGSAWCVNVYKSKTECPIIADKSMNIGLENDIYHVVPIKFFNVKVDKKTRYTTKCESCKPDSYNPVTDPISRKAADVKAFTIRVVKRKK